MDRFNGQGVEAQLIIEMVAEDSEEKGMFEDSVKLFDLAANHQKVVELLNKLLAQVRPSVNICTMGVWSSFQTTGCIWIVDAVMVPID